MPAPKEEKNDDLVTKLLNFICCQKGCANTCRQCCDCCFEEEKPHLSKEDIQYVMRQPVSRGDSAASSTSYTAQNSPIFRERMDSDNRSRTGSTSSNPSDSGNNRKSSVTPVIDMKPIEFWAANRETVQPRTPRRRMPSESEFSLENFNPDLYELNEKQEECLTDEQKLARYKLGQIHFGLQYEIPTKCLIVKVIEARELPPPYSQDSSRQDMAHSNPYAKVCLLPDQKNSQQSSVQRKTQSPTWGEIFAFEIPFKEAQRRTLEITVKDFDKYSRHCIIGQVHLPLANVNLVKGGHMWKPLLPSSKEKPDLGEILLSLNYLPTAGRLNVDVIKAKQLLQTDLVGGSDPFVKITLCQSDKMLKTKKTTVKKNTIDPVFNESFSFNVTQEQLEKSSLVITVWDHNSKSRDDLVGRIILGRQATGPHEITHWNRMLQCQRSPVAQWHTLRTRQECDQLSSFSASVS